ncbi:MAG: fused MFS/spermidine synthase [Magnetococcales bacterium]|nr:fused MFS/spermidine synthase [Magnetococcales bacterium]
MNTHWYHALRAIAFGAAFLLFQMELIAAKTLLPHFGGSFLVWSVTVMFFQGTLILGYLAVHLGSRLLHVDGWFRLYRLLLLLTLPTLLLLPTLLQPPEITAGLPFLPRLLLTLLLATGGVFWSLATLGVGTQRWLAASNLPEANNPFALYGVSNLGALIALVSYPLLIEPHLTLKQQITLWQTGYLLLTLLQLAIFSHRLAPPTPTTTTESHAIPAWRLRAIWFLLPAASNALYLATTNLITIDLAAVPLLWTLPLGVFLLTFWLTFKARPWYPTGVASRFYLAVPVGLFLFLLPLQGFDFDSPIPSILMHLLTLFFLTMTCHGELHRLRPADPAWMTDYYLTMALGGFAGALLVGWGAPASGIPLLIEYPLALLLATLALALDPHAPRLRLRDGPWIILMALVLLGWPRAGAAVTGVWEHLLALLLAVPILFIFAALRDRPRPLALTLTAVVAIIPFLDDLAPSRAPLFRQRNHYGIYRIFIKEGRKILKHGTTYHGAQRLDDAHRQTPQLYYHPVTPIGRLFAANALPLQDVAVIGLGAGSLAAYSNPGQNMTFFELDPDDATLARDHFSYLRDSRGKINLRLGDARLSLATTPDHGYDLLVVDAFNSDAVPVHLLTTEALALYQRLLRPNGVILFHISSRFLDLERVLTVNGAAVAAQTRTLRNPPPAHTDAEPSHWLAMTWNPTTATTLTTTLGWSPPEIDPTTPPVRPWTDDYSNILDVLIF